MRVRPSILPVVILVLYLLCASAVQASVIALGVGAFGSGSTLINFTGIPDGTEVNGLNVGGLVFSSSLGNGLAVIDGGPGTTNNVAPPNIIGSSIGILTVTLPGTVNSFGMGYAVLSPAVIPNATTITLFQGVTQVGSLSYTGNPDPTFAGGFAGILSTIPFNSVQLRFTSTAPSFAVDNVRTANITTVPETSALVLLGIGLIALRTLSVAARR